LHALSRLQWAGFVEGFHLIHRLRSISFILLTALLFGMLSVSYARDSVAVSSAYVIRLQLQNIADEAVDQAKLDSKVQVTLLVEGEGPRTLAENAFIETLQKRGYSSVISTGKTSEQTLHVFLLSTDIKVRAVDEKYSERNINTAVEVRTVLGMDRKTLLLGNFHREGKDTAQVFPSVQTPTTEEESVMQQLLSPLIIISGAFIVVYLFYSLRSSN
jgi:hypothetical protein